MATPRTKLAQAQLLLRALELPVQQQNAPAGYSLLALAHLGPADDWAAAEKPRLRVHDMLTFIGKRYRKRYAENSRESIRRRVLHQFEQARIVDRNPDDPTRPTNSGLTCYALTDAALAVVRVSGTVASAGVVAGFLATQPGLAETYRRERQQSRVEVVLPDGLKLGLSAGRHNELQVLVLSSFHARFVPDAKVLYVGDTAKKDAFADVDGLAAAGVPYSLHDKLPDMLFHLETRGWLILVEAVSSHGPVSAKRRQELESVLKNCPLRRVYVSAFASLKEFKKHVGDVAWDTEVWIAETADHMIHFNGPKFLGPAE